MRVTICMTFTFEASHKLTRVPVGHKCGRMHGHSYKVDIMCQGEPDERGMVCDYAEIEEAWSPLFYTFDHHTLNDVDGLDNPTTENLAALILRTMRLALPCVAGVKVYETHREWCEMWA